MLVNIIGKLNTKKWLISREIGWEKNKKMQTNMKKKRKWEVRCEVIKARTKTGYFLCFDEIVSFIQKVVFDIDRVLFQSLGRNSFNRKMSGITILNVFLEAELMIWCSPSRSAPSSTSPIRSVPADESSSNREFVLRSNAMFSMPLVGVLIFKTKKIQKDFTRQTFADWSNF